MRQTGGDARQTASQSGPLGSGEELGGGQRT